MNITTNDTITTYNRLTEALDNFSKVYYIRFGDGDLNIMNGSINGNLADKLSHYDENMENELIKAILIDDPNYIRGLGANYPIEKHMKHGIFAPHDADKTMVNWLSTNPKLQGLNPKFESHVMFHYMACFKQNLFIEFLDKYIRPKKKLYVGCIAKQNAEKLLGPIDEYVNTPESNAYFSIQTWYPKVLDVVDKVDVVISACGRGNAPMAQRLWNADVNVHFIDIGSVVDVTEKKMTRTWIRKIGWKKIEELFV